MVTCYNRLKDALDGHALLQQQVHRRESGVLTGVQQVPYLAVLIHEAYGCLVLGDGLNLELAQVVRRVNIDAHELRHCVSGGVVGPVWCPVSHSRKAVVREPRPGQQGLDEPRLWLGQRDQVAPCSVDVAVGSEGLVGPVDTQTLDQELLDHELGGPRVVLVLGNYDDLGRSLASPLGLPDGLLVLVPEHRLPVPGDVVEERPRRDLLLLHDVPQGPPASRPRVGEVCRCLVVGHHPCAHEGPLSCLGFKLLRVDVQGCG